MTAITLESIGYTITITGLLLISIGVYGFAATRNLIRMLLSLEIVFNGVFLVILEVITSAPVYATILGVILVSVVSAEVAVVVAIIAAYYRKTGVLDSESAENVEGGV
ncbi:MAG: NADH-quinone oxidoreductase subunit K [Desulfurococcales archaeon]|nr:NADH-quinone oxidoreductase subunit K [Desulfurococcales archaeon]